MREIEGKNTEISKTQTCRNRIGSDEGTQTSAKILVVSSRPLASGLVAGERETKPSRRVDDSDDDDDPKIMVKSGARMQEYKQTVFVVLFLLNVVGEIILFHFSHRSKCFESKAQRPICETKCRPSSHAVSPPSAGQGRPFSFISDFSHCQTKTWPWHLKNIKRHFVKNSPEWDSVHLFNNATRDGLRRYLTNCIIAWSNFSLLVAVLGIVCFVISNELYFNFVVEVYLLFFFSLLFATTLPAEFRPHVCGFVQHLSRFAVCGPADCPPASAADGLTLRSRFQPTVFVLHQLSTLILCFSRWKYYDARFRRRILNGKILPGVSLLQSGPPPLSHLLRSPLFSRFRIEDCD